MCKRHTKCLGEKSKGHILKTNKKGKSFMCTTSHLDIIQSPIKLHEDILNGYRVMVCTRIFGKKLKGHNLEAKKGEQPFLNAPHHLSYKFA